MKNKMLRRYHIVNYITEQNTFKGIFFLGVLLALYGVVLTNGIPTIVESFLTTFTFYFFNIALIFLVMLYTYNTYNYFSKKFDFYLIRLKNKHKALKETVYVVVLSNILYFFLLFLIYLCFLIFFKVGNIGLSSSIYNGIADYVYLIFYLIRYFIYVLLFTILNVLIINRWNHIVSIIFLFLFCLSILSFSMNIDMINRFIFNPGAYFSLIKYGSFSLEICYSLLYLIFLEILVIFLYHISKKKV